MCRDGGAGCEAGSCQGGTRAGGKPTREGVAHCVTKGCETSTLTRNWDFSPQANADQTRQGGDEGIHLARSAPQLKRSAAGWRVGGVDMSVGHQKASSDKPSTGTASKGPPRWRCHPDPLTLHFVSRRQPVSKIEVGTPLVCGVSSMILLPF